MLDWFNLIFRFVHIIAAIMWIGNSFLFMWMEFNLQKPENREKDETLLGEMWMLHGGWSWLVQKRKLKPDAIPDPLFWFYWQSYSTWLSGFALMIVLFYATGGILLVSPTNPVISGNEAIALSLLGIFGGFLAYDLFWRSPIKHAPGIGAAIMFALVIAAAAAYDEVFSGRATYLQIGAIMATWMSGNVFFHIIPNQRKLMARLEAGEPHSEETSIQGKIRSKHNNYITFPVIFLMLSNHYPQVFGVEHNILVMAVIISGLIIIKHMMNIRYTFKPWLAVSTVCFFTMAAVIGMLNHLPAAASPGDTDGEPSTELSEAARRGKSTFSSVGCIACHVQGAVNVGPSLHGVWGATQELNDGSLIVADEAYMRESILNPHARIVKGYQPVMPPYGAMLTDEQLENILAYLEAIGGGEHP